MMHDKGGHHFMYGTKSDILSASDSYIFLGFNILDLDLKLISNDEAHDQSDNGTEEDHLVPSAGFLDTSYYDRTSWRYGRNWNHKMNTWHDVPFAGSLIVFDDDYAYSYKAYPHKKFMSSAYIPGQGHKLRADSVKDIPKTVKNKKKKRGPKKPTIENKFNVTSKIRAFGLVLTKDLIFMAGTEDKLSEEDPWLYLEGRAGALLQAVSPDNGQVIYSTQIPSRPVFDGMIAAHSRLYIASDDGKVSCYAGK
jgi:hypothetical protein